MRWLWAGLLVACADPHVVQEDRGQVRVWPEGSQALGTQVYSATTPLAVTVTGFGCSVCDEDQHASCTVSRDGAVIRIASVASWIAYDGNCTREACGLTASCGFGALPEGAYRIVFGSGSALLTIPSELEQAPWLWSN